MVEMQSPHVDLNCTVPADGLPISFVRASSALRLCTYTYLLTCTRAGVDSVLGRGNATIDSSSGSNLAR